jgi:hypothetical protein
MLLLVAGVVVFAITGAVFWMLLPRGGVTHRFVGTEAEPYIGVGFCAAVALSCTMMLSGVLNIIGAQ